jgi:predicted metal-dependent HD superfamily phosphohydrolase
MHSASSLRAHDRLSHKWRESARCNGCETTHAEVVLDELLRTYSEPNRQYHSIEHIGSLLRQLEEHGHAVIDGDAVVLAMLFHDVVHDPLRHDNEKKCAALAGEQLAFLGFPGGVIAKVEQYINATKHALDFVTADCDLAVLLDLDLSTLAAAPAEYRGYSQAIRREYAHVPDELYRRGRRRVLEGFLGRQRIYRTDHLHALLVSPTPKNGPLRNSLPLTSSKSWWRSILSLPPEIRLVPLKRWRNAFVELASLQIVRK